jgi:hypothetical protein
VRVKDTDSNEDETEVEEDSSDDDDDESIKKKVGKSRGKVATTKKKSASKGKKAKAVKAPPETANFEVTNKTKENERLVAVQNHSVPYNHSGRRQVNELQAKLDDALKREKELSDTLIRKDDELKEEIIANGQLRTKWQEAKELLDHRDDDGTFFVKVDEKVVSQVKKQVVKIFRDIKFINSQKQEFDFGDRVMDMLGERDITRGPKDTDAEIATVTENRRLYRRAYDKIWVSALNDHRNSVQVSI